MTSPRMSERAKEPQRDPTLRKLSQHLLHMITPSGAEKLLNSGEIEMDTVQRNSILEDQSSSQREEKFDLEKPHKGPALRKSGEVVRPVLEKGKENIHQRSMEEAMNSSSGHDHIHESKEPEQELKENYVKSQRSGSRNRSHFR